MVQGLKSTTSSASPMRLNSSLMVAQSIFNRSNWPPSSSLGWQFFHCIGEPFARVFCAKGSNSSLYHDPENLSSKMDEKKLSKNIPKIDTFSIAIIKKKSIIIIVKGMGQAPRTEPRQKGEHVNHGKSCKGEWDTGLKSARTNLRNFNQNPLTHLLKSAILSM